MKLLTLLKKWTALFCPAAITENVMVACCSVTTKNKNYYNNDPVTAGSFYFSKTSLRRSGIFIFVFFIANLFFAQFGFGQAGPLRLKGTGGTVTEVNISGVWYQIHTYTSTGASTFTPPSGASSVEYLVVAGGGGGGNSSDRTGGGGGAGGVLNGSSFAVTVQGYTVTVGAGGAANTAGNNSVFGTFTAVGGGRGGQSTALATSGGSGGGGYHNAADAGRAGTAGQGTAGGSGYDNGSNQFGAGGGGGQSQAGANGILGQAGKGGNGFTSSISGTSAIYAGGGGGGYERISGANGLGGAGGTGGGGAGAFSNSNSSSVNGSPGTSNTGGGGGGAAGSSSGTGGAGGSGIVIVRYKAPTIAITTQASSIVPNSSNFAQPIIIQILDGNGSPVSGIIVTAAIESGTGGSLNNITATTDANGYATFTNLQISGPSGNSYTLNFTVPGSTVKVISNAINICPLVTASAEQTNVQCFNTSTGTIIVTGSGGLAPYTFSIHNGGATYQSSNTFNGLPIGIYLIRVKDFNGCESKLVQ